MHPVLQSATIACVLVSWTGFPAISSAETVSKAVGFGSVTCTEGSDTVISIPFHRPPSFSSAVDGSPVVSANSATISHQAERSLENDELTSVPHFLQFTDGGTRSGRIYPVTAHDDVSITIDLDDDNLSGVVDGDRFQVIPYWTLATVFPPATQSAIHVSSGKLAPTRKTKVMFFDQVGQGSGLAPNRIFFLTNEGWFRSDLGFPPAGDTVIPPGHALVVRHQSGDGNTTFMPRHVVFHGDFSTPLRTRAGGDQDNTSALVRPVPVKLSDLDLGAEFSNSSSTAAGSRADELLVFDNATRGFNKPPAAVYFKVAGQWRRDEGAPYPVADNDEIPPSSGLLIRKSASATGATVHWVNTPRY